jgi:hypothetical protein
MPNATKITYFPDLLTEQELIQFLRLPEVSKSSNYSNVIKNLIRFQDLPRIQICKRLLFPRKAILEWIEKQTIPGKALTAIRTADISSARKKKYKR